MILNKIFLLFYANLAILCICHGFTAPTASLNTRLTSSFTSARFMGDHSSATRFQIGDSVIVVDDVMKMGRNLKGLDGIVVETWEKCDVDPT